MADKKFINVINLAVVSVVALLIGAFLPFYSLDLGTSDVEDDAFGLGALFSVLLDTSWTALDNAWHLFPLATVSVLLSIASGVVIVLAKKDKVSLPPSIFSIPTIALLRTASAASSITLVFFVVRPFLMDVDPDEALRLGSGAWCLLAGSIGVTTAIFMGMPASASGLADDTAGHLTSRLIRIAGASLILGSSFLPFYGGGEDGDISAWDVAMRPISLLPTLAGVLVVLLSVVPSALGQRIAGVISVDRATALRLVSVLGVLWSLGVLIANPVFGGFESLLDKKIGMFLTLAGAAVMLWGSIWKLSPSVDHKA